MAYRGVSAAPPEERRLAPPDLHFASESSEPKPAWVRHTSKVLKCLTSSEVTHTEAVKTGGVARFPDGGSRQHFDDTGGDGRFGR